MKVGVALAGGGLKGVAYIGALKAFEELGIQIDYISGTSSGSMAAVLYSIGCAPEEMKKIIYESYKELVKIFSWNIYNKKAIKIGRLNFWRAS